MAEAEHYLEFAEAALVHVVSPGRAKGKIAQSRSLGTLSTKTSREAGEALAADGRLGRRRPMYETGMDSAGGAAATDAFPDKLVSTLEGIPGAPMQILRLMRRGDWRCKGI